MIDCTTTTGPLAPRLRELASATGTLSGPAIKLVGGMLKRLAVMADREAARTEALHVAIAALSAGRVKLSTNRMTLLLLAKLNRFESGAYRRICAGHITCRDELEFALFTLLQNPGPRCKSKLSIQVAVFLPEKRGK